MSTEIPSWAIAVAVLFVSIIIIFSVLFIVRKRLLKRGLIGVDHQEKHIGSSQVTLNRSLSTFTSPPESPYTIQSSRTQEKSYFHCSTPTLISTNNNPGEKSPVDVSTTTYQTLPPPSSSFFADKMELDSDEAQAIYNAYVNGMPQKTSNGQNIQQRAAALSTNLTKSIRRKSMANLPSSIVQFFEKNDNNNSLEYISNNENSSSSKPNGPTLQTGAEKPLSTMSLAKDLDDAHSTKIMIDDEEDTPYFNIPFSPSSPAPLCNSNEDAAVAARKAIQSASRKSRTRSMIVADETAQAMFAMIASTEPTPPLTDRRNSIGGLLLDHIQNSTAPRKPTAILEPSNSSKYRRHSVMLDNTNSTTATIRKTLQSSWSGNNLKESNSIGSLGSEKPQENLSFSSLLASRPTDPPHFK